MYDPYVEKADIKKLKRINFVNKPKRTIMMEFFEC